MQKDIDPKLLEEERRPTSPSTPLNIYGGTCTCDTTINFGELCQIMLRYHKSAGFAQTCGVSGGPNPTFYSTC